MISKVEMAQAVVQALHNLKEPPVFYHPKVKKLARKPRAELEHSYRYAAKILEAKK